MLAVRDMFGRAYLAAYRAARNAARQTEEERLAVYEEMQEDWYDPWATDDMVEAIAAGIEAGWNARGTSDAHAWRPGAIAGCVGVAADWLSLIRPARCLGMSSPSSR